MNKNEKGIAYITEFVRGLCPDAEIQFSPEYKLTIRTERALAKVNFSQDEMDDFEVALEQYTNTNYFYTLENRIKFRVYMSLGQEGLLDDFDISSIILNEKGEWLETYRVDVAFTKSFCEILYEGLKLLSDSLNSTLANANVKLPEIVDDAESVRHLIGYYEHHGNLTSRGAEIQSLSFLKAAAVCVILQREQKKKETDIPRLKKAYDKEIYSIVSRLRESPFRDIQLPECIYEYAIQQKKTVNEKSEVQKIKTSVRTSSDETAAKLDKLLEQIDPRLKKRRQGAWSAFRSDNPDRLSQAANSMVELLDQVIGQVCKDTGLAIYLQRKYETHEETKWVDATRKWISETKGKLNRVKHHIDYRSEKLTERLLATAESIILVILE